MLPAFMAGPHTHQQHVLVRAHQDGQGRGGCSSKRQGLELHPVPDAAEAETMRC
jgi:hypothetical protein